MQSAIADSSCERERGRQAVASAHRPTIEELNSMTLQVVMIGQNGTVLATDTAETKYEERSASPGQVRTRTDVNKITSLAKWKVTYAPSGDECADEVGERLGRELDSVSGVVSKELLERVGSEVYKEAKARLEGEGLKWDERARTLLVVSYEGRPVVWRLRIESASKAREITGQAIAGDEANVARFFIEHYYRSDLNVEEFKRLAAYFIRMGHERNTAMVGQGVEMRVFTEGSETSVSRQELTELRQDSEKLDDLIRSRLVSKREGQDGSTD
jgi:hypothetical protein